MPYLRAIRLRADGPAVDGELVDDFHHFRVTLRHDGHRITHVEGAAVRFPWTTCPGATGPLAGLAGLPLGGRASALGDHADARLHCTHLFDLAGLAVAHATRHVPTREYRIEIPDRVDGCTTARLARDGEALLAWDVRGQTILAPEPFAGVKLRGGFMAWADSTLDAETAEAAIVLRRACDISIGATFDLDSLPDASSLVPIMRGTCFSFQPGIVEHAARVKGSTRDLTADGP